MTVFLFSLAAQKEWTCITVPDSHESQHPQPIAKENKGKDTEDHSEETQRVDIAPCAQE